MEYYLTITGRDDTDPDPLARLERACETAFPRGYQIDRVDWHPDDVLGTDPAATAALALQGAADRTNDWQTPLTPCAALVDENRTTTDGGARPPLATVADALADSPVPAVYQTLLRPYRDWNGDRAERMQALEAHQETVRDQLLRRSSARQTRTSTRRPTTEPTTARRRLSGGTLRHGDATRMVAGRRRPRSPRRAEG